MQKWPLGGALSGCPPGRWNFEQKKEQGDCILPALSFSTNTKGVFFVRIFQRTSIGVRVATWVFTHHSEQVVSISALWTSLGREIEVEPLDTLYVFRLLKAGRFFYDTVDSLRATFQIPLKDSFYSLIIKKPITKYCILAQIIKN